MELLCSLPPSVVPEQMDVTDWRHRNAARAVLLNDRDEVALMHVAKEGYYKLPGGGFEGDEQAEHALVREMLEETGCAIAVERALGRIDEYREGKELFHVSYCYLARVVGEPGQPQLTREERARGFEVVWLPSLQAALEVMAVAFWEGRGSRDTLERDMEFLQTAMASV